MYSWNRDPGFYKTPIVKSLLVLTSASSILHNFSIISSSHPAVLLVVRAWATPSMGAWLTSALVIYHCRLLERRRGSCSFMGYLFLSGVLSLSAYALLFTVRDTIGLSLASVSGTAAYALIGALVLEHFCTVMPLHSYCGGLPLSSNFPFYLLATLFSATSPSSLAVMACGMLSGFVVRSLNLSLPCRAPSWLTIPLKRLFAQDPAPRLFSGASLSVQAQQRTDEIERIMAAMYTRQQQHMRRRVVIGRPMRQAVPLPSEEHVQQLLAMGFSRPESIQALQHTGNVEAAIQLLTAQHLQHQ